MGDLGLHGITVDEEYGGLGLGYLEHVVAMEEVSRASASVGLELRRPLQPLRQPASAAGPIAEQKQRYLPKLISGEHVGSLAMSEAGSGSDVVSMKLKAEKRRRPLRAERHEVLDHQRAARRHPGGLRQDRARRGLARHHRLPRSRRA